MTSFDLISQPWIPVLRGGIPQRISLQQTFAEAHEIDGLGLDDPHQTVALLRQILLPAYLHACGAPRSPEDWGDRWDATTLPVEKLTAYLEKRRGRFDLFDETAPFGQVAGLRTTKDETKPISLLIPRLASGNNVPLFSARTEDNPPALDPAEAVLALLAAQCWDTAAIKSGAADDRKAKAGKTTGNPTGPLGQLGVVVPWGRTLKETLLLNSPYVRQGLRDDDEPPWVRNELLTSKWTDAGERLPAGPIDLMTWQSRRIRLVPQSVTTDDGRLVVTVSRVVVCAGDRLAPTSSSQSPDDRMEWHTAWKSTGEKRSDLAQHRPVRHEPGRSAWRGLQPLLATRSTDDELAAPKVLQVIAELTGDGYLPDDYPLQVITVGVRYGNQSAVVEDAMFDAIPLPVLALTADADAHGFVLELVRQAEDLRRAVNRLGDDLRFASGADKVAWDKSQHPGDLVIHRLDGVVRRVLASIQAEPGRLSELRLTWVERARREAWAVADALLDAVPDGAFYGRPHPNDKDKPRPRRINASTSSLRFAAEVNRILGSPGDEPQTEPEGELRRVR